MKFKPERYHKLIHSSEWLDGLLEIYLTNKYEYMFVWKVSDIEYSCSLRTNDLNSSEIEYGKHRLMNRVKEFLKENSWIINCAEKDLKEAEQNLKDSILAKEMAPLLLEKMNLYFTKG